MNRFTLVRTLRAAALGVVLAGTVVGCSSKTSETANSDKLTENVGKYDPAPANATRPRVGVPQFQVTTAGGFQGGDLNSLAADQMSTLLEMSGRFRVIERAQLQKLLDEQNLEGIVKPGEMAKSAQVRGVNYLLIGKVTNLRVKTEKLDKGFGLAKVGGGLINIGGADYKKTQVNVNTECGVDIRLVDPTTGEVVVSSFSEYKKTDSASSMGLDILGGSANAGADINISEDDKGKILRLALDDALRKAMPKIDAFVRGLPTETPEAAARNVGASTETPAAVAPPTKPE